MLPGLVDEGGWVLHHPCHLTVIAHQGSCAVVAIRGDRRWRRRGRHFATQDSFSGLMWASPQLSSLTHPLSMEVLASILPTDMITIARTMPSRIFIARPRSVS